jgi:hypothetical protein
MSNLNYIRWIFNTSDIVAETIKEYGMIAGNYYQIAQCLPLQQAGEGEGVWKLHIRYASGVITTDSRSCSSMEECHLFLTLIGQWSVVK